MLGPVFRFFIPETPSPNGRLSALRSVINPNAVIAIRWLALAGQSIALIVVFVGFGFNGPLLSAFILVLMGVIMNFWQSWRAGYRTLSGHSELLLALTFDVVQLAGLLYLTGGMSNPFAMLFLAPIVVSAALLNLRSTIYLVLLVALNAVLITHFYLPLPFSEEGLSLPRLYLSGLLIALLVSCVFIGFYVWFLADKARRTTAELAAMQLLLERDRQVTVLGTMAAAAAHKLGSPLNTISVISHDMLSTLQKTMRSDDPVLQDLGLLNEEVERCRIILSELDRDKGADSLGRQVALPASQMILSLLDDKISNLSDKIILSSGPLDSSAEPMSKPLPDLKYALETLIDNAASFASAHIKMDIGWTNSHVDIAISDDGPGFNSRILARLGQPWNSSREGQAGHKGLGLFLAFSLIESLEGNIEIENQQEGGTMVRVTLPRSELL